MPSLKPAQLAFFSYAHEDAEFALRLAKDLRAGGAAVWIDRLDIKPGQRWDRAIEDALAKCPQLLVIISPDATESTNVMDEVSLALEEGKTVLPVVHRQCKIPFRLRRLQYVDLTLNYNEGLGQLLETLGFAVPPSEVPEDTVDEELTRPSRHDGGAKEAKLLSHAAPQEEEATARMPKKRALSVMVIVGTAAVLVALALLAVVVNVFKQQKKRPSEQTAQGPSPQATQLTASGPGTSKPAVTIAETPVIIDAAAQYELAQKYEKGIGVPKNPAKALQLYEQSAASGYPPARFTLGVSYELGHGVSKDLGKAVALYRQAADQGNSDAICKLGFLSEYGIGMPKNTRKAIELYQKAAAQDNAYGQLMLGHLYEFGDGMPKDIDRAVEAYTKAADMGNAEAKNNVARLTAAPSPMATVAEKRARDYESAIAYNKSGIKKAQTSDFAGALADYDHAIELDPGFVEAYNNRAGTKERIGDLPGALSDCGRATEIDPNYYLGYLHRAFIHYELRDFRTAINDFQRASEINPKVDYPHLYVWLAEMHLGQREHADRELADYFGDRIKAPGQDHTGRIAAFLLDRLTLAEFLPRESPSDSKNVVPHSETLFFAGMKCLFTGHKNEAARYLRSSVDTGRVGPAVRAAQAELKALGATATSTSTPTAEAHRKFRDRKTRLP